MPTLTETIMKSSQISRIIISASIVAIVGLLTYNWAVSPQASYLQAAQRYETLSQNMESKSRIMSNALRVKKVKLEKLQAQMASSSSNFFSAEHATDFFAQLEKISANAGCNLETVTFEKEKSTSLDDNDPQASTVTEKKALIKFSGTYEAIINLTSTLKDYPQTIYLSKLIIQSIGTSTDNLACSMNIKVYLTEDKELILDE